MIRKVFYGGCTAALVGLGAFAPLHAAELRSVTVDADGQAAQLTLDLDQSVAPKVFTLEHPDRLVIDFQHTHRASALRPPPPSGVVAGVRFGSQPGGTLRVVVQLNSALVARTAWTGSGRHRLLLSLGAKPAIAPAPEDAQPVRAVHAPGEGDRDVIVAVDAGHGGQDPGAIGHGGTREKDVTLAIARALAERLNAEPGMHAVLTRDRDELLSCATASIARLARADMFISVHADSIADRSISGASVYVLSVHGASNEAARWLAERENAADLMGGVRLDDKGALAPVLLDATQSEIIGVSASAAERVVSALENVGEVRKAQVQHAGFVVLKSPDIPSMLVETAYISNPTEERRLRTASQQSRLADAIAAGLRGFFTQNPTDGTRFKQQRRTTLASAQESLAAGASP
jgi:N-acetylmuramoyl-L-alanine amidase